MQYNLLGVGGIFFWQNTSPESSLHFAFPAACVARFATAVDWRLIHRRVYRKPKHLPATSVALPHGRQLNQYRLARFYRMPMEHGPMCIRWWVIFEALVLGWPALGLGQEACWQPRKPQDLGQSKCSYIVIHNFIYQHKKIYK